MLGQTLAIAKNTFSESIRQPVTLVLAVIATILIILSNPFSGFTMQDDQRMFIDIGLSTVFICAALLAGFIATNVLGRELDNRTVLTVISKPVARGPFVLGKFIGVAGTILLTVAYMSLVFLIVERHGTMQTVTTPYHLPALLLGGGAAVLACAFAIWCNFFYGKVFGSTFLLTATPLLAIAYVFTLMFGPGFERESLAASFRGDLLLAIVAMATGLMVLTAIAIAASTRLGQVLTVATTIGLLLLGLLSDWLFARPANRLALAIESADAMGATTSLGDHALLGFLRVAHLMVPNFQVFWLVDALTQRSPIPTSYMGTVIPYGVLLTTAILAIALALFQRREVG